MRNASLHTRVSILKVALQLFLKKGYKDVSYQDLIKETGLSQGAIYHHFKSKEDLLVSTFEFLLEAANQSAGMEPEKEIKDIKSFKKIFIDSKKGQFKGVQKLLGTKILKFNKLLFFLEAISENIKLRKITTELLKQEIIFLEKCFIRLKKHTNLLKGKDPAVLAESLFLMLQGTELLLFFVNNSGQEEDFIKMYNKTLDEFFKII